MNLEYFNEMNNIEGNENEKLIHCVKMFEIFIPSWNFRKIKGDKRWMQS